MAIVKIAWLEIVKALRHTDEKRGSQVRGRHDPRATMESCLSETPYLGTRSGLERYPKSTMSSVSYIGCVHSEGCRCLSLQRSDSRLVMLAAASWGLGYDVCAAKSPKCDWPRCDAGTQEKTSWGRAERWCEKQGGDGRLVVQPSEIARLATEAPG
jgi:hypothetical protein